MSLSGQSLALEGTDLFDLSLAELLRARQAATLQIARQDGRRKSVPLLLRIETPIEPDYFLVGGILPYVLEHLPGALRWPGPCRMDTARDEIDLCECGQNAYEPMKVLLTVGAALTAAAFGRVMALYLESRARYLRRVRGRAGRG